MKTLNILSILGVAALLMTSSLTASAQGRAPEPRQPRMELAPAPENHAAPARDIRRDAPAPRPEDRMAPRPDDRMAPAPVAHRSHLDPASHRAEPAPLPRR